MKIGNRMLIAFCMSAMGAAAAGAALAADGTTRAEKAEAICTGAAGEDEYRRWEIDPNSQMCPATLPDAPTTCTIRLKNDPSVTYDYQCPYNEGGDDNAAAEPITVEPGSRTPKEQ